MEAKTWQDTIIPIEERIKMGVWQGRERQAQAQAEISFKAGQASELEGRAEWGKLMYKAGMEEVVEWIEDNRIFGYIMKDEPRNDWQAQLKKWGMGE